MFHFIWFKRHMFWYYVAYVYYAYMDGFKVHWQTIYCEKFTVEETGHFTCIICVIMDDEKAREPLCYRESPSWPGMCISILWLKFPG